MTLAETVDAMVAAGCSAEQVAAVAKALDEERRSKTRRDVSESEWYVVRSFVLERDGFRCTYCGGDGDEAPLHCDHVIPRSRGGKSTPDNLVAACRRCNSSKRASFLNQWVRA